MSKSILPGPVAGQHQSGLRRALRLAALGPVVVGSLALFSAGVVQAEDAPTDTTVTQPADTGTTDGGTTDGGSTDGGSTDGGSTDGGSTDGGSTDGGSTDGGSTDGGSTDGETTEPTTPVTTPDTTPDTTPVELALAPVIDVLSNGRGAVTLNWSAADLVDDEHGVVFFYNVIVKQGDVVKASQIVFGDVLHTSVAGLTNGEDYSVIVNAITSEGLLSSVAKAAKPVADAVESVVSEAVSGLAVTRGNTTATATWSAPAKDGGQPVVAYVVNAVNTSTGQLHSWRTVGSDVRSASIVGLAKGIAYDINVFAVTGKGFGAISTKEIVGAVTGANPVAPKVATASAYAADDEIVVSWLPAAETGVPVINYNVVLVQDGVMKAWSVIGADGRSGAVSSYDDAEDAEIYIFPASIIGFGEAKKLTIEAVEAPAAPAATTQS